MWEPAMDTRRYRWRYRWSVAWEGEGVRSGQAELSWGEDPPYQPDTVLCRSFRLVTQKWSLHDKVKWFQSCILSPTQECRYYFEMFISQHSPPQKN
jgi:hypothetical protein